MTLGARHEAPGSSDGTPVAGPVPAAQIDDQLEDLHRRHLTVAAEDVVSYYAPEGGGSSPGVEIQRDRFGICVALVNGGVHHAGDWDVPFALQSISKVFAYGLALADHGREHVLRHVGVEPTGDAFNSLVFDEHNHRPFNPMVNAGALATTGLVRGADPAERLGRMLGVLRGCAGVDELIVDPATFEAEMRSADRNRATAYLMRSEGMLTDDVEATLALYLQQCSVRVTCRDLAVMAATLANGAINPITGVEALPREYVRDVLSVMHSCGMYDFAGEWAYSVGLPAKSGVSGGLMVVVPGKGGIAVFSPGLDRFGNSVRGTRVCQELSERLGLHLFATEAEDALFHPEIPAAR
jgi:glutaminase